MAKMKGMTDKEPMDKELIEIYLPNDSLQGTEIPFYMLWDKSKMFDLIKIIYPSELRIKEIYNVSDGNFELENNTLYINKVDVNGYLGIKFISKLANPITEKGVYVEIYKDKKIIYKYNKYVKLFRPDIRIDTIPDKIYINVQNEQITILNKIKIVNKGLGTSILRLECIPDSDISIYDPMSIEEFRKNFWNDIEKKSHKICEKYPRYSNTLLEFVEIGRKPPMFTKNDLNKIKSIFDRLIKILEEDEEFLKDFANMIFTAYLKNLSIITELETFLIYLASVYENKIILLDAVNVMKISTTPKKLKARIYITDLAYNEYKPIELNNITIVSNKEIELPVYLLFDFSSVIE